jgi:hypothetical protein
MPKKKTETITEELKDAGDIEGQGKEEIFEEQPEPKKKKAYEVVLIGASRVVYRVSDKLGNSTTPLLDVWKGKLKVGDTIYLDEE